MDRLMNAKIEDVLEMAQREVQDMLGDDEYIDDVKWGTACFNIPVWKGDDPMRCKKIGEFFFRYDPDDVWERSVWEQLNDKLIEFQQEF